MEAFNQRLERLVEQRRRKERLLHLRQEIQEHLNQQSQREYELRIRLADEKRDVTRLEGLSLTGLFHAVLGNKEAQLERERQEYLAAKLQYDTCRASLEDLIKKKEELDRELNELAHLDDNYEQLMGEKESYLLKTQGSEAARLTALSEKIGELQADLREIREAVQAGQSVLFEIDRMLEQLSSAEGWGIWDMVGGGFLSTAIKHSKINDAQYSAQRIQQLLGRFQRELADVDRALIREAQIEVGSFLTFADFFFDGLIADWMVQSKINHSQRQTEELQYQIRQVLNILKNRENALVSSLEQALSERRQLVEEA